jgi:pilus assembly protein CpaD
MFVVSVIPARVRAALLLAVGSFIMAGCQTDRIVTGTVPSDYRERHPIQINEGNRVALMHIGTGRSGLTPDQRALAGGFASQWRRNASGPMTIDLPAGVANEIASGRTVRELQSVLVSSGVPPRAIQIRSYQPNEPSNIGAIRLTFPAITAQVANRCHVGRDDLGVTPTFESPQNYPASNFGCATQHNLAASVANPEDLVQPRNEQPGYAARRRTVIDKYRQGQDPSTTYNSSTNGAVSQVGR